MTAKNLLTLLFALSTATQGLAQPKEFVLHAPQVEGSPTAIWISRTYEEVFRRLNIPLRVLYLPHVRGAVMTEVGEVDGQFNRFHDYSDKYPNQIRVDEPIYSVVLTAVVPAGSDLQFDNSWQSFSDTGLKINYVRGIEAVEKSLKQHVDANLLASVSYIHDGLVNLKYQHSDVFIHGYTAMKPYLDSGEFKDHLQLAGTIERINLYPFVHRKHSALAPSIASTLTQVKAEGLPMQYCMEAYGPGSEQLCRGVVPQ
ncbi:hypothetical protein [Reinekea marinisedimentorum]|uniref:ABC-type amino acid transport substrate-binding protein n=1 Tax=Reinekea marinisedimentorum TaxID=230495 RepID=A0A4R3IEW4_9GAMM|nr:hypothetical protein [Reinekea marinisedimentorum]TCS43341.1 hypothetical protein BCF53_102368 [Reinekea marinisedimentorum]